MDSTMYGRKLNPFRRLQIPLAVKATRQSVVATHTPSTIDQGENLLVRFKGLDEHDVIVPGTVRLAFTITLKSTDADRTVVQNLGRALIANIGIKLGEEFMALNHSDVYYCYRDLWKTPWERANAQYQGIDTSAMRNITKLRISAADGDDAIPADKAIAAVFSNRFCIPLDTELLESHMPFYQKALGDHLQYMLKFNDYKHVIKASNDPSASYTISNIALEYDKVNDQELARQISNQYASGLPIYYERVTHHIGTQSNLSTSDGSWNFSIDVPCKSLKGVLMLFKKPAKDYTGETELFYNPQITDVQVSLDGVSNKIYGRGMKPYHQYEEARKFFAGGSKRHAEVAAVTKDLHLSDVTLGEYLTSKYALWLDLRSSDDDSLHGSGRRMANGGSGIALELTKKIEAPAPLKAYMFLVMDGQLNIQYGRHKSTDY